jgi:hypothetical protein
MRYTLHVIALAVLIPAGASAQTTATTAPVPYNQVISMNPFLLIVSWVNGEYERRVSPSITVGASASRFDFSDAGFAATNVVTRWYPQGAALDGFYFGARLGAFRFKSYHYDYSSYTPGQASSPNPITAVRPTLREQTTVVPGAGLEIGYNWLFGRKDNISVGIGAGLTRTIGGGSRDEHPDVLPTLRLANIGVAF